MTEDQLKRAVRATADAPSLGLQPGPFDAGPAILAATGGIDTERYAAYVGAWLERLPEHAVPYGLIDGTAGLLVGVRALAANDTAFARLQRRLAEVVHGALENPPPAAEMIHWHEYDLISGVAGAVLALDEPLGAPARVRDLAWRALATRPKFRVDVDPNDPQIGWNSGRVNAGLAHGVPGVLAALARWHVSDPAAATLSERAISMLLDWLIDQSYETRDARRLWGPGERLGHEAPRHSRRQAWCYGVPGVSWAMWEAGSAVGRHDAQAFAADAFARYARAFDPEQVLDAEPMEAIAFCHGATGILAVADAFEHHSGMSEAGRLADNLEMFLFAQLDRLIDLARADSSLLTGSSGVLAVLLLRRGGDRTWLRSMALK